MNPLEKQFKTIIKLFYPKAEFLNVQTPICDLIVRIPNIGTEFAAYIISSDNSESKVETLISKLKFSYYDLGIPKIPIIVGIINAADNSLKIGIVIDVHETTPLINKNPDFKILSTNTASELMDKITEADNTLRILDMIYCRIIKRINFQINTERNISYNCSALYLRNLTLSYKMNCKKAETEEDRFERLLNGTPENEYPADKLDYAILNAIKTKYPDAHCKSSLLLFNTDLQNLKRDLAYNWTSQKITIKFCPTDVNRYPEKWVGTIIPTQSIDLFVQNHISTTHSIENNFTAYVNCSDIKSFNEVISDLKSINKVSQIIL